MGNSVEKPKFGEIWMCDLGTYRDNGSVQGGRRPVFIMSNDKNNKHSPNVNILPITHRMNKRGLPVHVELWDYEKYGLKTPSTVMAEQVMTISASNLDYKMGEISDRATLLDICRAMVVQLPIFELVGHAT